MASSHVNPEEKHAVKIMLDLEADYAFGMHWEGTSFDGNEAITDEDDLL